MSKFKNPFLPPTTPAHIQSIKGLMYWMFERERIRRRKAKGKKTLTEDPIMRDYRFCNVRREDDLVSQWLIDNLFGNEREVCHV